MIGCQHLEDQNESYGQHFLIASKCGIKLILLGTVCVIHAFLPWVFQQTTTSGLKDIWDSLQRRKDFDQGW